MSPRTKNLALAAGAAGLLGIVGVNLLVTPSAPSPFADPLVEAPSPTGELPVATPLEPSVSVSTGVAEDEAATARSSYAIGLHELAGLPPDAAPGTSFELWVTWEPPVTEEARLHRLIGDVVLERVIPGTVPEAPVTALLSIPEDRTGDLIYADTFGRLNVVLPG